MWYDVLNWGVEGRVIPFRKETAGRTWGDVLEIGGGTGANIPYYPSDVRLTLIEPDNHMVRKLRRRAPRIREGVTIVQDVGEKLPFEDATNVPGSSETPHARKRRRLRRALARDEPRELPCRGHAPCREPVS